MFLLCWYRITFQCNCIVIIMLGFHKVAKFMNLLRWTRSNTKFLLKYFHYAAGCYNSGNTNSLSSDRRNTAFLLHSTEGERQRGKGLNKTERITYFGSLNFFRIILQTCCCWRRIFYKYYIFLVQGVKGATWIGFYIKKTKCECF